MRYQFDSVKPGSSFHFRVRILAKRATSAFRYWREKNNMMHLSASYQQVGDDDPDGPGWRMFIVKAGEG